MVVQAQEEAEEVLCWTLELVWWLHCGISMAYPTKQKTGVTACSFLLVTTKRLFVDNS